MEIFTCFSPLVCIVGSTANELCSIIIYFALKSRIGDRVHVNTEMNDILRQLKITITGIVKFQTGKQRNMLMFIV